MTEMDHQEQLRIVAAAAWLMYIESSLRHEAHARVLLRHLMQEVNVLSRDETKAAIDELVEIGCLGGPNSRVFTVVMPYGHSDDLRERPWRKLPLFKRMRGKGD